MKSILTLAILLIAGVSFSQNDSKVTTGVLAYKQQEYKKALEAFNTALEYPGTLKPKKAAEGYYYRAKALIGAAGQIAQDYNAGNYSRWSKEEQAHILNTYIFRANDDLNSVSKYDEAGKYVKLVDTEKQLLLPMALQGGLGYLNASYSEGDITQKNDLLESAIKYLDVSTSLKADYYVSYDLRGQAYSDLKKYKESQADYKKAIECYSSNPPETPDLVIGYVYYQAAMNERYYLYEDPNDWSYNTEGYPAAYDFIQGGKAIIEKEYKRAIELKGGMTANEWMSAQQAYNDCSADLARFELDLLLNWPEKLDEALQKFEKQIKDEPNNYTIHVAYAQLLEKTDFNKAEEIYKKAIEIDPKQFMAPFNLGAMYVNKGVEIYKKANEESDFGKAEEMMKEGKVWYEKALPYLEAAQIIEACDREVLTALTNVCINLELMDKFKQYKEKKTECGL